MREQHQRQFSEELQLLGKAGDFDFVAGLYYFNEHGRDFAETRLPFILSGSLASSVNTFRQYSVESTSKAAFGQVSWRPGFLDRKFELTGGLRYTKDSRDFDQTRVLVRSVDLRTDNTSYLVSASYQLSDGLLAYVKHSTGYRAGGFNVRAVPPIDPRYLPENIKATEAGFKLDVFNRSLRFNAAAFHNR